MAASIGDLEGAASDVAQRLAVDGREGTAADVARRRGVDDRGDIAQIDAADINEQKTHTYAACSTTGRSAVNFRTALPPAWVLASKASSGIETKLFKSKKYIN